MYRKTLEILFSVFLVAVPLSQAGHATEGSVTDTAENRTRIAKQYLEVFSPDELLNDSARRLAATLPENQRKSFMDTMTKNFDRDLLKKTMLDALARHFTAQELQAMVNFYSSPEGKSSMKKFGAYMAEVMPIISREASKAAEKTRQQTDGAQKHQP